jgi:lysophospholipase L1-like esterase
MGKAQNRQWTSLLLLTGAGLFLLLFAYWLGVRQSAVTKPWHSVVFHSGLFLMLAVILDMAARAFRWSIANTRLLTLGICIALSLLEVFMRLSGLSATYTEMRSGFYQSSYPQDLINPMRVHLYQKELVIQAPEYSYPRTVNAHGFSDGEFTHKQPGQLLIQTYGDSFTEGDGAPYDSAYPTILRLKLQQEFSERIVVQNFGIRGNDPGFYWRQLRDLGLTLRPDIIIINYGSFDFATDMFTRGGLSRFHNDRWSALPAPWWEFVYANSHAFRRLVDVLFGISPYTFLTTPAQQRQRLTELQPQWNEVFDSIAKLAEVSGAELLVVKKPERSEIDNGRYEIDLSFFDEHRGQYSKVKHYDLLDHYLDTRGLMADSTAGYYWKNDGHHNAKGYALMAEGVHEALLTSFPEYFVRADSTAQEDFQ